MPAKLLQWCLTLCDPKDSSLLGTSVHGDSPGKGTGVVCHFLLQGIFPTQGSKPGLPHCRQILYQLSHKRSPRILEWVAYPSPADLPYPGIEPGSPSLQADSSSYLRCGLFIMVSFYVNLNHSSLKSLRSEKCQQNFYKNNVK